MDNIEEYANIVIYPDGLIEGNKITNYSCHMEYLIILANNSPRLRSVFEKYNIDLSINSDFSKEPTYSTDLILAKEGIIVLHNMVLDDETAIAHSEMKSDGKVKVYIEKPVEEGFYHATCWLPDYHWSDCVGFSDEEPDPKLPYDAPEFTWE